MAASGAVSAAPVGFVGRRGLVVDARELIAHVGGRTRLQELVSGLTVREFVPRRSADLAFGVPRRVSCVAGDAGGVAPRLVFPPALAEMLVRRRIISHVEPGTGDNAPFTFVTPARAAERYVVDAGDLYQYQGATVAWLRRAGTRTPGTAGPLSEAHADRWGSAIVYVQMGAGLGKTRAALAAIASVRVPCLVIVPTEVIRDGWISEAREVMPEVSVGRYIQADAVSDPRTGLAVPSAARFEITVAIINTVRDRPREWFDGFGMTIFDEAHEYHTETSIKAVWRANTRYVLALSATPDEDMGRLSRTMFRFFGAPIRVEDIPGADVASVNFGGRVLEVAFDGQDAFCVPVIMKAGTLSHVMTVGRLIEDQRRTRMIAAAVKWLLTLHERLGGDELLEAGLGVNPADLTAPVRMHSVLVFASHRRFLPAIRDAILECVPPADLVVPELDEGARPAGGQVLWGGSAGDARERAHRARIVLTTYGYSRRGVSMKQMTACVLATPQKSGFNQIYGRIFRRGSDESIVRVIVDVVDMKSPLRRQNSARRVVAREKGFVVDRVRLAHADFAGSLTVGETPRDFMGGAKRVVLRALKS